MDPIVIPWVRGSRTHYAAVFAQPDGSPAEFAAAELRITVGIGGIALPGRPADLKASPASQPVPGWVFDLTPEVLGDLTSKAYAARLWRQDGAGEWSPLIEPQERVLNVMEDC